jgi:peptidoglycan/LPS O-acetylase OafA/YrhL
MMNETGHIKSLDGIRAIAILLVMSFHAGITHFGWMGVQLFFVLSGFLITGILWREKQKQQPLSFKLKKFWGRRTLRIFPLYFGYLFFFGLTYILFHFPTYYLTYFPYLVTYTCNFSRLVPGWEGNPLFTHLWSLSVEEQFYLFFPLVLFALQPRYIKWFLILVIVLSPLTRFFLGEYYAMKGVGPAIVADAVYWNTLSHLDAFFIGGLIPVLSLDKKLKNPGTILFASLALALFAGWMDYINGSREYLYLTDLGYKHGQTGYYEHVWHYSCLNLVFFSLILYLVSEHRKQNTGLTNRFFTRKWMIRIGKVSYGMYMFHWAILVYVYSKLFSGAPMLTRLLLFLPYVLTVYLLAELSYRFYESWFIRLKDRWFGSKDRPAPQHQTLKRKTETPGI